MNHKRLGPFITLICLLAGDALAQSASHQVTVQVSSLSYIQINNSTLHLIIGTANATPGNNTMTVSDNTTTLWWATNASPRKITIVTDLVSPKYTLWVVASNQTAGNPSAQQIVPTTGKDFIRDISRTMGSCSVVYTLEALATAVPGDEFHHIVFTVSTQ